MRVNKWIEKDGFEKLKASKEQQLVLLAADWCGYCNRFISIAQSYQPQNSKDNYELNIVNIESEDGSLWESLNVDLVPTLIVFQEGEQKFRRDAKSGTGLQLGDLQRALAFISGQG
ncbi:MAG: thioredoxin family protein [Nitrososphaerales archaeon]